MTDTNNGGPAYPTTTANGYGGMSQGMDLRDWFAGQALAGLCAYSGSCEGKFLPNEIAGRSYEIADAMIAAREPVAIITEEQP